MTAEVQQEHRLAAEMVPVRIVDSDVHNVPRRGELAEFIPAPYRRS